MKIIRHNKIRSVKLVKWMILQYLHSLQKFQNIYHRVYSRRVLTVCFWHPYLCILINRVVIYFWNFSSEEVVLARHKTSDPTSAWKILLGVLLFSTANNRGRKCISFIIQLSLKLRVIVYSIYVMHLYIYTYIYIYIYIYIHNFHNLKGFHGRY